MYRKGLSKIKSFAFSWQLRIIALVITLSILIKATKTVVASRVQLDGFAAIVDGKVVLESDIDFEAALMAVEKKTENLDLADRKEILGMLIDRQLLLDQAKRFTLKTIPETEVMDRVNRMDNVLGGREGREKFLLENGIDELFWRTYIHNRIILENYIEQRFRAFARITREQEDQYISDHIEELGLESGSEPEKAVPEDHYLRKIIRALLSERIVQERIAEFLQELRSTAIIVYSNEEPESLAKKTQKADD